jgi:long-subunit acyl-CoA synthetase (AMP-forming)
MNAALPEARTVMQVMDRTVDASASRPAMKYKSGDTWHEVTWSEYREKARLAARAMIGAGLQPGKGVAILGYNRPEWFITSIGAIFAGGLPAGIYTTNSPEQCHYIAQHAECAIAVVENEVQLAKFLSIKDDLVDLKLIVVMDLEGRRGDILGWDAFLETGHAVDESILEERIAAQKPADLATLIYTSGTTGAPKAVMLSHQNLTYTAGLTAESIDVGPDDRFISYLPLSHIAEQIVSLHVPMACGGCAWFAEGLEQLGENLREVRPTIFLGVPRVWEKIQAKIQAAGAAASPLKQRISAWAKRVGLEGGYAVQQDRPRPRLYWLADRLVFSKVRDRLGLDQAKLCISSAAPISLDTLEYFLSLGIPIFEVYGMSECTGPSSYQVPGMHRTGSIGKPAPGIEMRIAEDGEILMRGPHVFLGYYKNPEETKNTIDEEGWLHSGDVGTVDEDGFFRITDRKKDIIITAGGHNVAPQALEKRLSSIPGIAQAAVLGDRKPFLVALLTLDPERLIHVAEAVGSPARDAAAASTCGKFLSYVESQIDTVNHSVARNEAVKKFSVVPGEFTIDGGELTPTMKLRRRFVAEKYTHLVDRMYAREA